MKKRYIIACLMMALAVVMTGCSWEDFKAKFVGEETVSSGTAVSGATAQAIEIEDYDPNECVKLAEYKGVEVDCTVTKGEVYSTFNQQLMNNTKDTKKVKKGTSQDGDVINIDFEGKLDGVAFDGGTAQDQTITLGDSGYIDGFDEGMYGMKVKETKDIPLTFPKGYSNKELAGKDVVFTVTLNYILKPKNPEAFLKKNTSYKTFADYEAKEKENKVKEKEEAAGSTALQQVIEDSELINIPQTLLEATKLQTEAQVAGQFGSLDTYLQMYGMSKEDWEKQLDSASQLGVKQQLVVEAIAAKEGISISDSDVKAFIDENVKQAQTDVESFKKQYEQYYGTSIAFEDYMKTAYTFNKVLELVKGSAVIKK